MKSISLFVLTLVLISANFKIVKAQSSSASNSPVAINFLGWDNPLDPLILEIRQANRNRQVFDVEVNFNAPDGTVYNQVSRIAFPLQQGVFDPFSMHHLGVVTQTDLALRRDWMNVGTTFTENNDILHLGLIRQPDTIYGGTEKLSDAVLAWGKNDSISPRGPDNLRFIFLKRKTQNPNEPARSDVGLEVGRFTSEGNFGIGNFFTNGIYESPSQRLDVLGTGRFRAMESDTAQVLITGVEEDSIGDYTLNYLAFPGDTSLFLAGDGQWRPGNGGTGGDDFDWEVIGNVVATAHGTSPYPQTGVAIGSSLLNNAKLYIERGSDPSTDIINRAIRSRFTNPNVGQLTGIEFEMPGGATQNVIGQNWLMDGSGSETNSVIGYLLDVDGNAAVTRGFFQMLEGDGTVNGDVIDILSNSTNVNDNVIGSTIKVRGGLQPRGLDIEAETALSPGLNFVTYGIHATAHGNALAKIGVFGEAVQDGAVHVGVWGQAFGATARNIGVYGQVDTSQAGSVAGYFAGPIAVQQAPIILSDISLKANIQDIENASEMLLNLQPKTYSMQNLGYSNLSASNATHFGLIAQEVQEVLPQIVKPVFHPAPIDTSGNFTGEGIELLGVQYEALVPLLVAGFKEQRTVIDAQQTELEAMQTEMAAMSEAATITESGATLSDLEAQLAAQQEQIDLLMEQLAACCSAPIGTPGAGSDKSMNGGATPTDQLHQNIPNPFKEQTIINFELVADSQVLLEITDAKGNLVATLVNGSMTRGQHRVEWNANGQAPGTYYYSLYTDKELLTKKMIKL